MVLTTSHNIPEIFLCAEDINNAQNFLHQKGVDMKNNPLIAVHAGSGSKAKNWPLENYVSFYKVFIKDAGEQFLWSRVLRKEI